MKYDTFVEFVKNSTTTCHSTRETDFCIVIDRKALVVVL